jgi:hypothetical protein
MVRQYRWQYDYRVRNAVKVGLPMPLVLRRANVSRQGGDWSDDDFDGKRIAPRSVGEDLRPTGADQALRLKSLKIVDAEHWRRWRNRRRIRPLQIGLGHFRPKICDLSVDRKVAPGKRMLWIVRKRLHRARHPRSLPVPCRNRRQSAPARRSRSREREAELTS